MTEVFSHPATSLSLQHAIRATLPYSITLAYRTQHSNRTEHAKILATFPPGAESIPKCWAAAYLDRSMRPETELWIFAAGEMPNHSSNQTGFCQVCRKAVLALLDAMSTLPTPPMREDNKPALDVAYQHEKEYPTPGPDGTYPPTPGMYMRHLLMPKVILVGACHEKIVQIMREEGLVRKDMRNTRVAFGRPLILFLNIQLTLGTGPGSMLNKFLFKLSDLPETKDLPKGLRWGEMREHDIETVKARTSIPRSTKTLLSMKSLGVFEEKSDRPVAWTFLGLDGSLTTLHTESDYRGKGLAKAVAAKICRDHAPGLAVDDEGNIWSHADVYEDNIQSEGVCKSLGGQALWENYWIRIDLERAGSLASSA